MTKTKRSIHKMIISYFLFFLPVFIILFVLQLDVSAFLNARVPFLNPIYGIGVAFWIFSVIYSSLTLLLSSSRREKVLTKLLKIKERDEREELLTAKATKKVFLINISLIGFFLGVSIFEIKLVRPLDITASPKSTLTIEINFDLLKKNVPVNKQVTNYYMPLNQKAILLILLCVQLMFFYGYNRREKLD